MHLGVHRRPNASTAVVSNALADGLFVVKLSSGVTCQHRSRPYLRQIVRMSAGVGHLTLMHRIPGPKIQAQSVGRYW
jgi:hypothetical protein